MFGLSVGGREHTWGRVIKLPPSKGQQWICGRSCIRHSHSNTGILFFQPEFMPAFTSLRRAVWGRPDRTCRGREWKAVSGRVIHFLGWRRRGSGSLQASNKSCKGFKDLLKRNSMRSMVPKILEAPGKLCRQGGRIFTNFLSFNTPNNDMVKRVPVPIFLFEYILTVGYCNIHGYCLKNNEKSSCFNYSQ